MGCPICGFDTAGRKLVETFDRQVEARYKEERDVKLTTEDGESQERFSDEYPRLVAKMLQEHER